MPQGDLLTIVVSALVGGGLFAGLATLVKAFSEKKRVPVDITITSLGGAEKALLVMKSILDEAEERIAALRVEIAEQRVRHKTDLEAKDIEIALLNQTIQAIKEQFEKLQEQLLRIQRQAQAVQNDNNNHLT